MLLKFSFRYESPNVRLLVEIIALIGNMMNKKYKFASVLILFLSQI